MYGLNITGQPSTHIYLCMCVLDDYQTNSWLVVSVFNFDMPSLWSSTDHNSILNNCTYVALGGNDLIFFFSHKLDIIFKFEYNSHCVL